jgi:hypothetical protein
VGGEKGMVNETWGRRECKPSRSSQGYLPIVQPEEQKRQRSRRESSSLFFRAIVQAAYWLRFTWRSLSSAFFPWLSICVSLPTPLLFLRCSFTQSPH